MRLLYSLCSTVALAALVSARIPAYERCASPDAASIPCEAGSACTFVNSTFSQCIPSRHGGSTAASAARRADIEKRDGEGGQVNLINGTPFKWVLDRTNAYQLNSWEFPAEIQPFSSASVYVEFKTGFLVNTGDSAGEASYRLEGTDHAFEVQARGNDGLHIQTLFTGLATPGNDQGSTLNLGWQHDGAVNFVLSGVDAGSFLSSNAPSDFMTRSFSTFADTPLSQLVLPASHDAGMFKLDGNTAGSTECNTLTQSRTIYDQLNLGARYFDLRPVISGGIFKTGHYSKLSVEEIGLDAGVGGNGEKFEFLINDINNFQKDKKELIILNLSHDFQTDEGYRGLNEEEWKRLFEQLKDLNNLYIADKPDTKLIDLPLSAFISEHSAVIVVAEAGSEHLGDLRGQGFFTYDQLGPFNSYSDSDDLNTMVDDQFRKMHEESENYFLLSFTLTQKVPAVVLCPAMPSILALADRANAALYARVLNESKKEAYPKLLYIDNFASSDIIPLAMAINYKVRA